MYENKAISSSSVFGFSGGFSAGFSWPNAAVAVRQIAAARVSHLQNRAMAVSPRSLECALVMLADPDAQCNGLMIDSIFRIPDSSPASFWSHRAGRHRVRARGRAGESAHDRARSLDLRVAVGAHLRDVEAFQLEIGRASCRERV